jgi:5'-deoxynucleotidase YfbR-like HD superfamily hydrolase
VHTRGRASIGMAGNEVRPPCSESIRRDVDVILWSMHLQQIRRFTHQRFWEVETRDAEYAAKIEPYPSLESVADHTWHITDCILILADYCADVNISRALQLAIVHDKMEIIIDDWNPLGLDGTGRKSHAFNATRKLQKDAAEREAIEVYLAKLRPGLRKTQEELLLEALDCSTAEARFVKAVDKLQALAFVYVKKHGDLHDRHIMFSLRYSGQACLLCPPLAPHFGELRRRLIKSVAKRRGVSASVVEDLITEPPTLALFDEGNE